MTDEEKLLSEITGEIVTSPDDVAPPPKVVKTWTSEVSEDQLGYNYRPLTISLLDKLKEENQRQWSENVRKREARKRFALE